MFLQTLLKHEYTDNVTDILTVFCIVCKIYFRVGFFRGFGFEGNNKYAKKVLRSNCLFSNRERLGTSVNYGIGNYWST